MAAEVKISELSAADSLSGAEFFEIVQSGISKKITLDAVTALNNLAIVGTITTGKWAAGNIILPTGGSAAGTGPLYFQDSVATILGTPEKGAMEFYRTGSSPVLSFTRNATRENVLIGNTGAAPSTSLGGAVVNYYGSGGSDFLSTPATWILVKDENGTTRKIPCY